MSDAQFPPRDGFPPYLPVTPEEAARNAAILLQAVYEHEAGVPESYPGDDYDYSDGRGLPPPVRAAVMLTAKQRVLDIAAAVRSRNAHLVQHLMGDLDVSQLSALVLILAEAAEPGRLLAVTQTADDGMPAHVSPEGRTHAA